MGASAKRQKSQKPTKVESQELKLIPFLNGKKLQTAKEYPPETKFLYERDYNDLMSAYKEGKVDFEQLDTAADNIVKYREEERKQKEIERERTIDSSIPQADKIIFGLRMPRRDKRKIKPGEYYKLVPFRNGYIARTTINHRPGTIMITLAEYNGLVSALEAGAVKEYQLDELAKKWVEIRPPEEVEAIEEYQRQNPPPKPKPKKKKRAIDEDLYPLVKGHRVRLGIAKTDYSGGEVLWVTDKEYDVIWKGGFGESGLKALLDTVKNYKLPLVDGHRIPKSKIEDYPPEQVEFVRMKEYIAARMPIPSISSLVTEQENNIKALAKNIATETAQRFIDEIIPESLSRHLSEGQLEIQKQDLSYGLYESLKKQFYWELTQARVDAKNKGQ